MFQNQLVLEQRQTLSVNQVQSLQILTYTNQELDNFLTNEYLENPMLDNSLDKQNDMIKDLENMYEKGATYRESFRESFVNWDEDNRRSNEIRAKKP